MASYVFRRVLQSIPLLFGIAIVSFFLVALAPGSPVDRFRTGRVSPATIQHLIRLYGLDQPLLPVGVANGLSFLAALVLGGLAVVALALVLRRRRRRRQATVVGLAIIALLAAGTAYLVAVNVVGWTFTITWPGRLISWLTNFMQPWQLDGNGNHFAWGYSFNDGRPVIEKILERVPNTLILMGSSLVLTVVIGIPVGVLAAVRQYSWVDKFITVLATIGYAMPTFWLGLMLKFFLAFPSGPLGGVFPLLGMHSYPRTDLPDLLFHMTLPVLTLTIVSVAGWSRYMRSSMLEVLHQDYVRTAKAKGLPRTRVIYKHALRNALIPIVTLLGLTIPSLLVGAAVTEFVFGWPGLGGMGVTAVVERDYPLVLAFVMVGGAMVILGNLLADVLYAFVDPRIKY
jgi:peptide/nickel transport system permease protein